MAKGKTELTRTQEIDVEDFMKTVIEFVDISKIGNINLSVNEDGECYVFIKTDDGIFEAKKKENSFHKNYL